MQDHHQHHRHIGLSKIRFDTLIDGVYSIALTLLVLDVKLPRGLALTSVPMRLVELLPNLIVYFIAFLSVAYYWISHYYIDSLIGRTDFWRIVLNISGLMFVALVPFSAAALGTYPTSPWAVACYCFNIFLIGSLYGLSFEYSISHLISDNAEQKLLSNVKLFIWGVPIVEGIAIVLALGFGLNMVAIGVSAIVIMIGYVAIWWLQSGIIRNASVEAPVPNHVNNDDLTQMPNDDVRQELIAIREQMKRLEAGLTGAIALENVQESQEQKIIRDSQQK